MNITHATDEVVTGDKLEAIFARQKELMEKYHHIEERSSLLQTKDCPVNLDDKRGQARIKDFAWRVMEEVGEALDAANDEEHYCEELIDGLHFLTELTILAGFTPSDLVECSGDKLEGIFEKEKIDLLRFNVEKRVYELVENMGMMCNCLKNKPWKQSNMITDKNNFRNKLQLVWGSYVKLLGTHLQPDDIVNIYLKKSQVNKFRQRSNY